MSDGIIVQSKQALQADSTRWAEKAKGLQVTDRESYVNASQLLRSVKGLRTVIADFWAPHIKAAKDTKRKADEARAALVDEQSRMEAPLVDAEIRLKKSLLAWDVTQEQIRRDQERALQAEAQRQAEAVTLAAAAELEQEATATGNADMLQEAFDILAQPIEAPVVVVKTLTPKVDGVTMRDQWKAHPDIDVLALAVAVGAGLAPVAFLAPNMTAINQFARATDGAQPVAGIRWFNDRQVAARA